MKKKFFSIIVLGFIVGSVSSILFLKKVSYRKPASQTIIGKHKSLFSISIDSKQALPDEENQDVELVAKIIPTEKIETEVYFNWVLPDDVYLVSGDLSDSIPGKRIPPSGFSVSITVQGLSAKQVAKPMTLQVYTELGDVRMGNAGVFNPDNFNQRSPQSYQQKTKASNLLPKGIQQ